MEVKNDSGEYGNDAFTYKEVKFWIMIIVLVATVVGTWGLTNSKIDLLTQELQNTNSNVQIQINNNSKIIDNLNTLNLRVSRIETLEGIKSQ